MSFPVRLPAFEGPLDLLLYLIRRDEIEIQDIPIAHITSEYLALLGAMESLDIVLAGEFLVMASTLMEIKSQLILPRERPAERRRAADHDPRLELVRQLLEYRRYKEAAARLEDLEEAQQDRFFHRAKASEYVRATPVDEEPLRADLWDLVAAYGRLLATVGRAQPLEIPYDDTPIEEYMRRLVERVRAGRVSFAECLGAGGGGHDRSTLVGLFLALLELVRQRKIAAVQERAFGEIWIEEAAPEAEPEPEPLPQAS